MEKKTEKKFENGFELPFGKEARCGNYKVLRYTKSLGKKELEKLRESEKVPDEVRKILNRGSLPFIKVSTISGSWSVEFCISMDMYRKILDIPVARDAEGRLWYFGEYEVIFYNEINKWLAHTSIVGDDEFLADGIRTVRRFIERSTEDPLDDKEKEEAGKTISSFIKAFINASKDMKPGSEEYNTGLRNLVYILGDKLNRLSILTKHTTPSTDEEADKILGEMEDDEKAKKTLGEIVDAAKKEA